MTITIDVPETIVHEAKSRGIPVEVLIEEKLVPPPLPAVERPGFKRFGTGTRPVAEVIDGMTERRKNFPLGDVTIKQLIDEGRRYL